MLKHTKVSKQNRIKFTRVGLPAKLPCHLYRLWLVSCSFLFSSSFLFKQLYKNGLVDLLVMVHVRMDDCGNGSWCKWEMISVSVLITEVMVLLARSSLLQFTLVGMSLYSNIISPGHNKINKLAYKNRYNYIKIIFQY